MWEEELDINKAQTETKYDYNGRADNIDVKCVFENNDNSGRRFVCSYYIEDKYLSPWRLISMIRIRET